MVTVDVAVDVEADALSVQRRDIQLVCCGALENAAVHNVVFEYFCNAVTSRATNVVAGRASNAAFVGAKWPRKRFETQNELVLTCMP